MFIYTLEQAMHKLTQVWNRNKYVQHINKTIHFCLLLTFFCSTLQMEKALEGTCSGTDHRYGLGDKTITVKQSNKKLSH